MRQFVAQNRADRTVVENADNKFVSEKNKACLNIFTYSIPKLKNGNWRIAAGTAEILIDNCRIGRNFCDSKFLLIELAWKVW